MRNKLFAPVVVYTYDRLIHLKRTIEALKKNHLANHTDLFIVSDGPRNINSKSKIDKIREYGDSITGFNSVNRIYRDKNLGAFESIRSAEHAVISDYGTIISMEDDIVTSENYLDFMNSGLSYFKDVNNIITISGYCHPIKINNDYDSWMNMWHCPWGYATWKNKYLLIDKENNPYLKIKKDYRANKKILKYGNFVEDVLISDFEGKIAALDARICGEMLLRDWYTVMPSVSKVRNIGCDGSGLHSEATNKFDVHIDSGLQRNFSFSNSFDIHSQEFLEYTKFMNGDNFQIWWRKFKRLLSKFKILRKIYGLIKYKKLMLDIY